MKKKLLLSILGMAATSAFGQGYIWLDNYSTYGPVFTYGAGIPANGVSGALGTVGGGLNSSWTAGMYFAPGNLGLSDPSGSGMPNAALALATGPGSTAQFDSIYTATPGEFQASNAFNTGAAAGSVVTVEIVVYPTSAGSYANALFRAHTTPFVMTTASILLPAPPVGGAGFSFGWPLPPPPPPPPPPFPEPSTLALAGMGACIWMACARRKNF